MKLDTEFGGGIQNGVPKTMMQIIKYCKHFAIVAAVCLYSELLHYFSTIIT